MKKNRTFIVCKITAAFSENLHAWISLTEHRGNISSESSVNFCRATWRYIWEDSNVHSHRLTIYSSRTCTYRVFFSILWPISIGPTLRPTFFHRCVVRRVSGRCNSWWWELDKISQLIMTFRKCNNNSLERRAGAIRQAGKETPYRSGDRNVYHVPLWSTSENAFSQTRHEIPTYYNYTRLDHNGVPTRRESIRWTHDRRFIVTIYDSNIMDGDLTKWNTWLSSCNSSQTLRTVINIH
jgi:hypothetical protein